MSRDIGVKDIQNAIADIQAWACGDTSYLPESHPPMLRAIASLLEQLLIHRDD